MPVQRFRSVAEMDDAPVLMSGPADVERFLRHCARYWLVAPRTYPRGVFKFRSVGEMAHPPVAAIASFASHTPTN